MAYEEAIVKISRPAGEDLDAAAKLYTGVKLNADGAVVSVTALTDTPIGVLQNDPKTGQAAAVGIGGVSKVVAGATITPGAQLSFNTAGKAIVGAAGAKVFGVALTGGANNEVISASINTAATPTRAA